MNIQPLERELLQRLPSPRGVALAIMEACRREDVSVGEVAMLVQSDPALTGRLLEQANAAALGVRPVVAASEAVARLGLRAVRQLALGFSLIDQYSQGSCASFDYPGYWSHCLLMGVAMRELGLRMKLGAPEDMFTCGLLARVGNLALASAYPGEYDTLLRSGATGAALLNLEFEQLHTDHLQLSSSLMLQWGIPQALAEPVYHHELPQKAPFPQDSRQWQLCQTLHHALRLADFVMAQNVQTTQRVSELTEFASQCGLDADDYGALVDSIVRQWRALGDKLKVQSKPLPAFEQLAQKVVRPDEEPDAPWLRVLVVDDDPIVLGILHTWLAEECQHTVRSAADGRIAQDVALEFKPHVVITDWRMPHMDGIALCESLRSTEWGSSIYVLMLTSVDHENELVLAFDAGVDDYVSKPVNLRALGARLKAAWRYVRLRDAWERDHERLTRITAELALSNRRLQHAAQTDPLTELANRRAGHAALAQCWSVAARHQQAFSILSLDVDLFKSINDARGHTTGDVVLQHIGRALRTMARAEDTVCRWGGEEFLVILPNMGLEESTKAAQRLCRAIGSQPVTGPGIEPAIAVTVSLGVATWRDSLSHPDQLLAEADAALYAAKRRGRDCVAVSRGGQVLP